LISGGEQKKEKEKKRKRAKEERFSFFWLSL
jgi:hypothetical protein